jgi:hypothetical protein
MKKRPNGLHTATYRNKRVLIVLDTGERFVDRFLDRPPSKRYVELRDRGKVPIERIRTFAPYRPGAEVERPPPSGP